MYVCMYILHAFLHSQFEAVEIKAERLSPISSLLERVEIIPILLTLSLAQFLIYRFIWK